MKKGLLNLLTTSGTLTGVITLGAIIGVSMISGGAMFSPGDLNSLEGDLLKGDVLSHGELARRCDACHEAFWSEERMQDRCVACHSEVAEELEIEASMHGFFDTLHTCRACHPEHRGTTALLTEFDLVVLPHNNVGFALSAHRKQPASRQPACRSCHPDSVREFDVEDCLRCHGQINAVGINEHVDTFHSDCLRCHDGVDRYGAEFDHQQTRLPLQGRHLDVACQDCHQAASSVADLQALSHQCADCHAEADIHAGRLGTNCDACHVPEDWQTATIDHALTAYPLVGAHVNVSCQMCHVEKQWVGLETTCYACHVTHDEHEGGYGTRCEPCHRETAWNDTIFDHALSALPLTGAHADITCDNCHLGDELEALPATCVECHADPDYHAGLFGGDCTECHTATAWFPISYYRTHNSFPLMHGGGSPSCKTCHPISIDAYSCYGCHEHTPESVFNDHKRVARVYRPGYEEIRNVDACYRCHPTGTR